MGKKEIIKAKYLGTCFGVERALKITEKELNKEYVIYSYGDLIHNNDAKKYLEAKGLIVTENIDNINTNKKHKIVFRSHGVGEKVYELEKKNNIDIIDATCPKVKKIHKIVKDCYNNGYEIIIFGNSDHPEISGIKGWTKEKALVFSDLSEFKEKENKVKDKKLCVVFQTTYNLKNYESIKTYFEKYDKIRFHNTICIATVQRQKACRNLAKKCDNMIVIGGKNSSNTKKLYEISKEFCKKTYWIENKSEIPYDYIQSSKKIGITAGASTPLIIIEEVIECLKKIK